HPQPLHPFPTRRSSDLYLLATLLSNLDAPPGARAAPAAGWSERSGLNQLHHPPRQPFLFYLSAVSSGPPAAGFAEEAALHERLRSEEHTSELQSRENLV